MRASISIISLLLLILLPAGSQGQTPFFYGKWAFWEGKSATDDSRTVEASLNADNTIEAGVNTYSPILWVKCVENKTELNIDTGMSSSIEHGKNTVTIRLDKGKAFRERWSDGADNKTLLAPNPITLLRKMNKANKMFFDFTPFNVNTLTAEFDISHLNAFLGKVAQACHWKI